jgi:nucleotide-binding universal stress UspA family protein
MFRKLLVPLDRSSLAEQAIGQAAMIARAAHAGIDLVVVDEPFPFAGVNDGPWRTEDWAAEQTYVETVAAELASGASLPVTSAVLRGDADLIVMTSHGRTGFSRAWLGSVADSVARRAPIPVLMLRPVESSADRLAARHVFKRVLVPLDGSPLAAGIVPTALDLANASNATVTLLRIVRPVPLAVAMDATLPLAYTPLIPDDVATKELVTEATSSIGALAQRLNQETHVTVETHVDVNDRVAEAIVAFAQGHSIDVIAMSTHGRGATRMLMGSVADKVLRGSGLPVLLRRPVEVEAAAALHDGGEGAELLTVHSSLSASRRPEDRA